MSCGSLFDFLLSGNVLSHDSVGIGWLEVLGTTLMGRSLGVVTCIGSFEMRYVPV